MNGTVQQSNTITRYRTEVPDIDAMFNAIMERLTETGVKEVNRYMNTKQAAEYTGKSQTTFYKYIKPYLNPIMIDADPLYDKEDIDRFMVIRKMKR